MPETRSLRLMDARFREHDCWEESSFQAPRHYCAGTALTASSSS